MSGLCLRTLSVAGGSLSEVVAMSIGSSINCAGASVLEKRKGSSRVNEEPEYELE